MFPRVVYPANDKRARVGKRVVHKPTGYVFEKSKNGRWAFVWEGPAADKVLRLYESGACTVRSAASAMGLCHSTVQKFLDTHNALGAKRDLINWGKWVVDNKAAEIKHLYVDKKQNIDQVAEHFGVPAQLISRFLRKQPYRRTLSESTHVAIKTKRRDVTLFNRKAIKRLLNLDLRGMTIDQYREAVKKMTTSVMYNYGRLIDPENKRSLHYHVDHIFSVSDGWSKLCKKQRMFVPRKEPIPLRIICHPANLQLLTLRQNVHKGRRSAYTMKELKAAIAKFESVYGEVFSEAEKDNQRDLRRVKRKGLEGTKRSSHAARHVYGRTRGRNDSTNAKGNRR